jgi:LAO/AO transport system kinase
MKVETDKILQGNQLAAARLIRLLEEGDPEGINVLKTLYPQTGKAFILGITGPPGAGKSTLVTHIITEFRQRELRVGVVAVDPSSPFSGGALLGDRLRMRRHTEDKGVFIRSMETRGHMGGLSKTTKETALVYDAMGYEIVLIETVGVGQDEVDVSEFAHTTAVVSLPGMGDDIQAMKAGLLEIGDIFVVNKADKPGADDVVDQLRLMRDMRTEIDGAWKPPIIKTVAINGEGVSELVEASYAHREYLLESGKFDERNIEREYQFFRRLVMEMAAEKIFNSMADLPAYDSLLNSLRERKVDPYSAAEMLIKGLACSI